MGNLCFRRANATDVPLLAALNKQLQVDEAHRHRMDLAELEPRMAKWLEEDGYEATIFSRAGDPAGYALYRRESPHVYLKQFFVCRDFRRRGIGRQAIEWLVQHVWNDSPAVYLDVLVQNGPGIAFWKAVGFCDYCVTMERRVASPPKETAGG